MQELGNSDATAAESGSSFTNTYELNGHSQTIVGVTSTNPVGFTDTNSVIGGSGTLSNLTLTYSGGTELVTGALVVNNATGSATGSGSLQLDVGTTLGGMSSTGSLTLASSAGTTIGGTANPVFNLNDISQPGGNNILDVGNSALTFNSGSVLTLNMLNSDTVTFTSGAQYVLIAGSGARLIRAFPTSN